MNNKRAFTLIELLAVMVILGIIMTLAIPAVRNITYNSSEKQYQYHKDLVHEAAKLYVRNYKADIDKTNADCINIPYEELIKEKLLEEEDITCEGNIILEKRSETGYNYKYYINCYDGETLVSDSADLGGLPLACQGVNGDFKVNYSLYEDAEGTVPYQEGEWTQYVHARYNSSSPYNYPIEKYQYTTDYVNWKDTETANTQSYTNMNTEVFVRAFDSDGNISDLAKHTVMGDSEGPTFTLSYDEDQYLAGGEVPITVDKTSIKDAGSGVDVDGAVYAFGDEAWSSTNTKNVAAGTTLEFKVKDRLGNIGYVKTETINVCTSDALTEATPGTAVAGNILSGKTAWVNGSQVTGTMANQGAKTATLNAGGSYTIPAGYHNGSGKITVNSLASQTSGTATAADILSSKTAWVNGNQVTGSMPYRDSTANVANDKAWHYSNRIYFGFEYGYYPPANFGDMTNVSERYITYSSLASVIGLTADKIVSGNTILGIAGTDKGYSTGYSEGYNKGVEDGKNAATGKGTMIYLRNVSWLQHSSSCGDGCTIDIKSYSPSNYTKFTNSNFFFQGVSAYAQCSANGSSSDYMSVSYNASTGILTVNNLNYSDPCWAQAAGSLYLFCNQPDCTS